MKKAAAMILALAMIFALGACGSHSTKYDKDFSDLTTIRFSMTAEEITELEQSLFGNILYEETSNSNGDTVLRFTDGTNNDCEHLYCFRQGSGELLFFTYSSTKAYRDEESVRLQSAFMECSPDENRETSISYSYYWYGSIGQVPCEIRYTRETVLKMNESSTVSSGEYKGGGFTLYGTEG